MNTLSDTTFERTQLQHLFTQYNIHVTDDITIVFGSLGGEARMDYSTWFIADNEYIKHKNSGFFNLMQHQLDIFIQYRSRYILSASYHGIIRISPDCISVEWINKQIANKHISSLKWKSDVNK
ncbi:hypothetical protein [Thalassotalea fusca]